MAWQRSLRVSRSRGAPAEAREFVSTVLTERFGGTLEARRAVADAELVVSELVTNAVTARCNETEVRVVTDGDRMEIWVWDDGPGAPTPRDPGVYDTSGRGLIIVSALARQWAVEPQPDGGKWVWARLPLPRSLSRTG